MEFKEMQVIWNNQNNEKLYVINEEALHKQIKRKSRSTEKMLNFFEFMMIFVNLGMGTFLIFDAIRDNEALLGYILPIAYLGFGIYGFIRRLTRRQQEVHFDETMVGELDKAIWRINHLLKQGDQVIYWYLIPLVLVFATVMILQGKLVWGIAFALILPPATYYGMRWEARKWHLPKKRDLESLREMILAEPED